MSLANVVAQIIYFTNSIIWLLGSAAMVLFMWGIVRYIYNPSDKHRGRNVLWALIAMFVLFSIWGILRLACNSIAAAKCSVFDTGSSAVPFTDTSTTNRFNPTGDIPFR